MIKYDFFEQNSLLIVKYYGVIDKPYLSSFIDYLFTNTDKQLLKKAIVDARDADFDFKLTDLNDILSIRMFHSEGFSQSLKAVYLIKEAKETVFTTLYANNIPKNVLDIEICSTLEYTIRYLGLKTSIIELEERINNLENQFLMK